MQSASLDSLDVEALQTDRYLEALLAAVERRAADVPVDPAVDPTLRLAARRLRDELVRTHPSFRFEERLARRLADAAARMRLAAAAGGEAEAPLLPFPSPLLADATLAQELANPGLAALLGLDDAPGAAAAAADTAASPVRAAMGRPLLVGGALTSAALSLAGAAFVAWRLTRGAPADPMARAVRAARAAREAAVATSGRATGTTRQDAGRRRRGLA